MLARCAARMEELLPERRAHILQGVCHVSRISHCAAVPGLCPGAHLNPEHPHAFANPMLILLSICQYVNMLPTPCPAPMLATLLVHTLTCVVAMAHCSTLAS